MTNYDILKQYEAHQTPVPSYEEWKAAQEQLNKDGIWYTEISHKKVLRENKQLRELLKECELWFTGVVGNMNDKNVGEHNRNVPIGNFEYIFKKFSQKIDKALK